MSPNLISKIFLWMKTDNIIHNQFPLCQFIYVKVVWNTCFLFLLHEAMKSLSEVAKSLETILWCIDVLSMFVLSKWQCVALPTHWHASVRTLFYWLHTFLDHTTNNSRKVATPRRVSASGSQNAVQNCHLDKTNMDNSSMHLSFKNVSCIQRITVVFL